MTPGSTLRNRRILVVDDNAAIHEDFRKVLSSSRRPKGLRGVEAVLFGGAAGIEETGGPAGEVFEVDSAMQGVDGLELVRRAQRESRPYALAFVDIRMPPGWDGIETSTRIWREDPALQVVVCTAYSDYSWQDMSRLLGCNDRWLLLKKPFDNIAVRQLAWALTEKWTVSRQLQLHLQSLEQIVRDRTRALESQKQDLERTLRDLNDAHSKLLRVDKLAAIGQLAAGVAHEINNPIGYVLSNLSSLQRYLAGIQRVHGAYAELLAACRAAGGELAASAERVCQLEQECDLDYILSDLESLIAESIEGGQRVRQIVQDLRDFSHVDAADLAEKDLNELIERAIQVAWNELKYKADVVREFGAIPAVRCWGGRLGQVFLNLLVNAAQAISGRGRITVRTGHAPDGARGQAGERVWVEVEDTGCGIAPENLERVFEPFFTTKEVGRGTGLGLHVARNIVEAHGGVIRLRSTLGAGTTFRVELPVAGPPEPGGVGP